MQANGKGEALIDEYLDAFLKANEVVNLTNITDRAQANLLHIEDSLAALPELQAAPDGLYGDLGSGGGFPGVPLALMSGRSTMLVDSVKKKMRAVKGILDQLGLSDRISVYDGRIEELAMEKPGAFAVVTARALSSLPSLLELASPLLQMNGHLICYKANVKEDERSAAHHAAQQTGMRLLSTRELILSDGETRRTLFVYEKVGKPRLALPRRIGMAQKQPLVG